MTTKPTTIYTDPALRHDTMMLFDVEHGNPNGNPDAANMPRQDIETRQGLVTDVALKRGLRDYVDRERGAQSPYLIYVQEGAILGERQKRAFDDLGHEPTDRADVDAQRWMLEHFWDVRTLGAVMGMGKSGKTKPGRNGKNVQLHWNCGQVTGPVQFTFARSVDPILPQEHAITRCALTNRDDTDRAGEADDERAGSGTMGNKWTVPYALYYTYIFFSPSRAAKTGVTPDDLALLWEALEWMWEEDRSSARGLMSLRGLYVFTHGNGVGARRAHAHELFDRISVSRRLGVEVARSIKDYAVRVDEDGLPEGVTLTRLVG